MTESNGGMGGGIVPGLRAFLIVGVLSLLTGAANAALPVIPGAYGFGMDTPAGRGGTIYKVTSLNASGPGTLAACVAASGPRVCVFEVSGVIRLTSDLLIRNPYVTIAGQTAPAPGIMIRGAAIWIATSHVLMQHITIRAGDDAIGPDPNNRKALKISAQSAIANIVVDHCSFSWGLDENVNPGWADFDNISFTNNIVAEGLNYNVLHDWSGYGAIIGGRAGKAKVAMIGNLFAHNVERNPISSANGLVLVNNVVYDHGSAGTTITANPAEGATSSSVVGNIYIRGPSTGKPYSNGDFVSIHSNAIDGSRVYLADNALLSTYNSPQVPLADQWGKVYYFSGKQESNYRTESAPIWVNGLVAKPVSQVRASVLANAGSRPGDRSAKDAQIVNDVLTGGGSIVNCVSASNCRAAPYNKNAGGWPSYAENVRSLILPADPGGDIDSDGYTNLEEWLHQMAEAVEGEQAVPQPPVGMTVQ